MVDLGQSAEGAAYVVEQSKRRFYVVPSALRDLPAVYLGRCPRLLHCAPLVLIRSWCYWSIGLERLACGSLLDQFVRSNQTWHSDGEQYFIAQFAKMAPI